MYARAHAERQPDQPCVIMASTGETLSYGEFEARANRLAHLLRRQGLRRLDHYSIFMENNARYLESCAAGERAGLYYTCINSLPHGRELAYIVNNSESQRADHLARQARGRARSARRVPAPRAAA